MRQPDSSYEALPKGFSRNQLAAAISPRMQELILLPTEKCNFRCTYCYEDFKLGKMSDSTQLAVERFVARRLPGLQHLRFSWFGGEPLLASDVVFRLSAYAKALCDANGVRFDGGMTTNAYLLDPDLARRLIELNQDFFQITLDGYGEPHDVVRQRADGKGTFSKIWSNLVALKGLDMKFMAIIRIHVRRDNQANLEILMRKLSYEFLGDSRFSLDFQHLRNMGGEHGPSVSGISVQELLPVERRLRGIFLNPDGVDCSTTVVSEQMPMIPAGTAESAGGQRPDERNHGQPYICYAAKANSLLIRSNGRIGKCTVAFNDDRNDIGSLQDDGTISIDNAKLAPWIRGLGTLEIDDVGCPIKRMKPARSPAEFKGVRLIEA